MKTVFLLLAGVSALWADPRLTAWVRSSGTHQGVFATEVSDVRSDSRFVYLETSGVSMHSLGALEARPSQTTRSAPGFVFTIPLHPVEADKRSAMAQQIAGVFLTGVPIYNPGAAGSYRNQNLWHFDGVKAALRQQSQGLLPGLLKANNAHSPLLGFALDGYPIYGPYGWDTTKRVRAFRSSYRLREMRRRDTLPGKVSVTASQEGPANDAAFPAGTFAEDYEYVPGSGDLDEHNGRWAVTPEYPEGTYAYFLSTEEGKPTYPYLLGRSYRGVYPIPDLRELHSYAENAGLHLLTPDSSLSAGRVVPLTFTHQFAGLEEVHEKQMHLMVVSEDLMEFEHLHPVALTNEAYRLLYRFPHGGTFWLIVDYTPAGGVQTFARFRLEITGDGGATKEEVVPDWTRSVSRNGIRAELVADQQLWTDQDIPLRFRLSFAESGKPVEDLAPYLGSWAHVMMSNHDAKDVIHVHATNGDVPAALSGVHTHSFGMVSPSIIETRAGFNHPGRYRLWLQVQHDDNVITFPFWLDVKQSPPKSDVAVLKAGQGIAIQVTARGFEPARITIPQQRRLRLVFLRVDAESCATRVVFPELGIDKALPLHEPVSIEIDGQALGSGRELHFGCGMGMLRGSLLVQ